MALTATPQPYGMRDIKLTPYTTLAATTLGTPSVDLPAARKLSFSESEEFEELRGDDTVVATHGSGPGVDWELEGGGISFEAVKVMYGGTVSETGSTPNQIKTFDKLTTDQRPYFKIEGQSISDNGGDFHTVLYRCKATGTFDGEQGDGAFWITGASGIALGSMVSGSLNKLYSFIQNETITAIA